MMHLVNCTIAPPPPPTWGWCWWLLESWPSSVLLSTATGARSLWFMVIGGRRGGGGGSLAWQGQLRGAKTGSSTAGGGPVFRATPSPAREAQAGPKLVAKHWGGGGGGVGGSPASPARMTGKGPRSKLANYMISPRPSSTGRTTLQPTAPVEPLATVAVPIEQVAQKRKITSPLMPRQSTCPTGPSSLTRWEKAQSRIKGDFITPPPENTADLPRKLASSRWPIFPEEMGKIKIGWWRKETVRWWYSSISSRMLSTRLLNL